MKRRPMQLFKYCKSVHMESLFKEDSIRIGTLFDYRRDSQYGEMVTDSCEGKITLTGNLIFWDHRFINTIRVESEVTTSEVDGQTVRHFKNKWIDSADL